MVKNKFLLGSLLFNFGFIASAEAVRVTAYLHNEDFEPTNEYFGSINHGNRNSLLSRSRIDGEDVNNKHKIPLVDENYDGKSVAFFSNPKKMNNHGDSTEYEYTWYDALETKIVLSYENDKGLGRSQSFPFSFIKGFYAYTLDLPDLETKSEMKGKLSLRLEGMVVRYPEKNTDVRYTSLGYAATSVHPISQDKEYEVNRMFYTAYRQPTEVNSQPFTFGLCNSADWLYKKMRLEGIVNIAKEQ